MKKIYCWHGTNTKKTAMKILKEGFKRKTYFASHLEDALAFGGKYVFMVEFPKKGIPRGGWQFWIESPYPADKIKSLIKYTKEVILQRCSEDEK